MKDYDSFDELRRDHPDVAEKMEWLLSGGRMLERGLYAASELKETDEQLSAMTDLVGLFGTLCYEEANALYNPADPALVAAVREDLTGFLARTMAAQMAYGTIVGLAISRLAFADDAKRNHSEADREQTMLLLANVMVRGTASALLAASRQDIGRELEKNVMQNPNFSTEAEKVADRISKTLEMARKAGAFGLAHINTVDELIDGIDKAQTRKKKGGQSHG